MKHQFQLRAIDDEGETVVFFPSLFTSDLHSIIELIDAIKTNAPQAVRIVVDIALAPTTH